MKLKTTVLASTLLSLAAFSTQAAQELTPEQAAAVKPFQRITFNGRFNAIYEAVAEASKRADKAGADAFYVQAINDLNGNNQAVFVDLYHKDAPTVEGKAPLRTFEGVAELPEAQANLLEPFDTVSIKGYFSNQPEISAAIAKAAKEKNAASFYIVRQADINSTGTNQRITAYVYKADAAKRVVQSPDAIIPADSEAGRAALAAGGTAAAKVEIPGVASSSSPSRQVGNFYETQSSRGGRYTVTLADGKSIQEVNKATAAQMTPFDSITFRGSFNGTTDMSEAVAKRAADKGAKYYHITNQSFGKGSNMTISADLFK